MKRFLALAGLIVANTLSAQQWQPLFNGKDLGGWKQLGGAAKYQVQHGEITGITVTNTPNSFLLTQREYTDFIFEIDVNGPIGRWYPSIDIS